MGPILVNTKQKVAALASGLAIATTGVVVSDSQASSPETDGGKGSPPAAARARRQDHAAQLAALLGVPRSAVTDALEKVFGPTREPPPQGPARAVTPA
jgi:hypothetical protein